MFRTSAGKPNSSASKIMSEFTNEDVSVVVCTKNSISGIRACLTSLREAGVGQLIVVDANSSDGTTEIAQEKADEVLQDPSLGLGTARNIGIAKTNGTLVLNMGSDNVMPTGELEKMIRYLQAGNYQGVSAQTQIVGDSYVSHGLNVWRSGRFPEGERSVIGTPTLFEGKLLRSHPYDPARRFSDDSELCERWSREFQARFAISDAICLEIGKISWNEVKIRAKMYGISDNEVFRNGSSQGWGIGRKIKSLVHPLTADFVIPAKNADVGESIKALPFLGFFTINRYAAWATSAIKDVRGDGN